MKRCGACSQQFQDQFNFCPVDGEGLDLFIRVNPVGYQPTIITENSLPRRLAFQIIFLIERVKLAWPRFRSNPRAFLDEVTSEIAQNLRFAFARPYLRAGLITALAIVLCIIGSVTMMERRVAKPKDAEDLIDPTQI